MPGNAYKSRARSEETPIQPAFLTLQYNFFKKRTGEPNYLYTNYDTLIEYIALLDILKSAVTANIGKRQIVSSCFNPYPANVGNIVVSEYSELLIVFQYISNKLQSYTVYLYLETALHVSSGTSTNHQERIQLYLQHLIFVTPLLLSAAILKELEPVCVFCGWHTPPTEHSNRFQLFHDSGR